MSTYLLPLRESDKTKVMLVGGKGANLGELFKMDGISVPDGFCVTTEAYAAIVGEHAELKRLVASLSDVKAQGRATIARVSEKIRTVIENISLPEDFSQDLAHALTPSGASDAYAVRSSATAEDSPYASFAGQHESYLNVRGKTAVLEHIKKCWASLFTERAVSYRTQNGLSHHRVQMAVLVQKMIVPEVAGVLFTADPITGHRKVSCMDACFGLGEALVSGLVNADHYKVRKGTILRKVMSSEDGRQALPDPGILELERLGRAIEKHFACPQDIEWCWAADTFHIVQSRPITTLFPIPEAPDREKRVYISVGHQQMMTDPMKPLGLSFFKLTAGRPMFEAGGRLFVDIAAQLRSSASRQAILQTLGQSDPLIHDALTTLLGRGDFLETDPVTDTKAVPVTSTVGFRSKLENDPSLVTSLITRSQESLAALKKALPNTSGIETFDFLATDITEFRKTLFDQQHMNVILAPMDAAFWINEKLSEWLGETKAADTFSQSVPHNITSEMGLALLDLADVIRPYPEVIAYLREVQNDPFLDGLKNIPDGQKAWTAIQNYLEKYGMRCVGEIDITRPRWIETPTTLLPIILSNIKNFEAGAGKRKFEEGRQEASRKEIEVLERLKALPDGEEKAAETKRMIDLVRNFSGYREYPKYSIVSRYLEYKKALWKEADCLVKAGLLSDKSDIFYLTFEELRNAVRTQQLDVSLITRRKEAYHAYERLTPPRVMTSDGEIFNGAYKRAHLPPGALAGLGVSSGIIEGRARVITDLAAADLDPGDILVTAFTDPSWTPLFVSIQGLVTEVGGLMTHGAVIAREYGLPAVVGVEQATRRIQDGQWIRVNGTDGYVELLPGGSSASTSQ